ncbi:MAG: single-stranded DNA-binding protein [Methyloprofundus sp.]|nr:single-stranded DNA-binding protein [Methyloprofundus sp.]
MANQEIKLVGNIGQTPTFKSGAYNLVEFTMICEEFKRDPQTGELSVREGSQNWYNITVWAPNNNMEALNSLKLLQKGMRVRVEGVLTAGLYDRKEGGEKAISLNVSARLGDVSLMLNRVESIQMRQSSGQQPGAAQAPAQPSQGYNEPPFYGDDEPF